MVKRIAIVMAALMLAVFAFGCAKYTHIVIEARRVDDYFCSIYEDHTVDITAYYGNADVLVLPESIEGSAVVGFGIKTFESVESITAVYIPSAVTSLPAKLFDSCPNLRTVYIPRSVTSIGKNVIFDCPQFTTILYEGTEAEWKNINVGTVPWTDNYVLVNAEVVYGYKLG